MALATHSHQAATGFQGCPVLGVGLGLRRPLLEDTLAATDLIDWLEFTPENYMGRGGKALRLLQRAKASYPLISHGVSLSLGSLDPISEAYLAELSDLFGWTHPAWFSDHLCFSSLDGNYFNDLMPLPRTPETVQHVASRLKRLQDRMQRPVLIENISQYVNTPFDEMPDAAFIAAILEQADCGLLLDVNNVYVNSVNHAFDPVAFLDALPLHRVVQIHVAGHHQFPEGLVDTHGAAVIEPVWVLLRWVLNRCNPCGVMLERDTYLPAFADLKPELQMIRQIWKETAQPEMASKGRQAFAQDVLNVAS
ncbi:DUF692 family multinuclear iron-containing protein [Vampirovibrio sp.]|uniref:DUF692 domain-containing protein n=1 Tax=Vampirovibrio sp. TaxID=2717857 RepID=UPI0035937953